MALPEGFVRLRELDSSIVAALRYAGPENFTGRPVSGYLANEIIVTRECAERLVAIQRQLRDDGFSLVVYDAYRPQKAVDSFIAWCQNPADVHMAPKYYPSFADNKEQLLELSYLSRTSNHCRGSTVDVTIVQWCKRHHVIWNRELTLQERRLGTVTVPYLDDGTEDMGSSFDYLDAASHPDASLDVIPQPYRSRRDYLRRLMEAQGFSVSPREWWHFWLKNDEPFKTGTFDFDITALPEEPDHHPEGSSDTPSGECPE